MNKSDMIEHIAKVAEVSKSAAERAVDAMVVAVKSTLRKGDAVTLAGSTSLQYSSCAVQQALATTSPLVAAKGRGWVNLY